MHRLWTCGAAALAAVSGDASATGFPARAGMVVLYSSSDAASPSSVPPRDVAPGQMVMITGDCLGESDKVNVVLSMTDPEPRDGWHAMLVTDMEMRDGNLRVRVPDMPQALNRVFRVRLYVGDTSDACVCEAGQIRISLTA